VRGLVHRHACLEVWLALTLCLSRLRSRLAPSWCLSYPCSAPCVSLPPIVSSPPPPPAGRGILSLPLLPLLTPLLPLTSSHLPLPFVCILAFFPLPPRLLLALARFVRPRSRPQINEQIVLYVLSRTLLSLLPRLYTTSPHPPSYPFQPLPHPLPTLTSPEANPRPIPPAPLPFGVVAALAWAGVMYMFRHRGERIQPGMGNSMRKCRRVPRHTLHQAASAGAEIGIGSPDPFRAALVLR
jgi:hypothetical protein